MVLKTARTGLAPVRLSWEILFHLLMTLNIVGTGLAPVRLSWEILFHLLMTLNIVGTGLNPGQPPWELPLPFTRATHWRTGASPVPTNTYMIYQRRR